MLKQAFRQGKELQKEVVLLSNMFSNRFDNLVNNSDKEDVINHCQNRNVINSQLPAIGKNKVVGHSKPEE